MSSYTIKEWYAHDFPQQYRNMIYAKWLRKLRYGNDYFKLVDTFSYYEAYKEYIVSILLQPQAKIRLAFLTDEPDVALGFAIYRDNILDFIYVQNDLRKKGIATKLLPKSIDTITHVTKDALAIWPSKYPNWKFNPFV